MRIHALTGAAGQMGIATRRLLEAAGHRVIGIDLRDAEVIADLGSEEGRAAMIRGVGALTDRLDGVLAVAGVPGTGGDPAKIISTDFFGAVATLEGLRPLLAKSDKPRAIAVSSIGAVMDVYDETLVGACLDSTETVALTLKGKPEGGARAFSSAKRALGHWIRRRAISRDWAGAGIMLNAVIPGLIMAPERMADDPRLQEITRKFQQTLPIPAGRIGAPEEVASLMVWFTSAENGYTTGQLIFVDGGWEVVTRGVTAWDQHHLAGTRIVQA